MADDNMIELLFCDTFSHENKEELNLDLVQFPWPVCVSEVRVIPRATAAHPELQSQGRVGETSPSTFSLELFINNLSKSGSAIFEKLGSLDYVDNSKIQFLTNSKVPTDGMVLRGWYHKVTVAIYGFVASHKKRLEERPASPPPPPPPKQSVHGSKRTAEEAVEFLTHDLAQPKQPQHHTWDWDKPDLDQAGSSKRPRYTDPPPEPEHHQPPPPPLTIPSSGSRRGPRTPSPPPPAQEQWDSTQGHPAEAWPSADDTKDWKTQDSWEAGEQEEQGQSRDWEHGDTWETTDTWEPGDAVEWEEPPQSLVDPPPQKPPYTEHWRDDRSHSSVAASSSSSCGRTQKKHRKHRGPRTPPGEPCRSPTPTEFPQSADTYSQDSRRRRERRRGDSPRRDMRRDKDSRRESETRRDSKSRTEPEEIPPVAPEPGEIVHETQEGGDELFEPLTPETSPSHQYSDRDIMEDDRSREPLEDVESEGIGQTYEEISDEEGLDEVGSLDELMDTDGLDGLEGEPWPDIVTFNSFQVELVPLMTYPSMFSIPQDQTKLPKAPEGAPEAVQGLRDVIKEHQDKEYGPRWVGALEPLIALISQAQSSLADDDLVISVLTEWSIEAVSLDRAMGQPIAVNTRQLKAGMRMVTALCDCGQSVALKLLDSGVLNALMALLFGSHMASSMKLMALKALDSATNWQDGIERFLGPSSSENDPTNKSPKTFYQRLVKLLLSEQTVRVVQAVTALLKKIHVYETLTTLHDTVNSILDTDPEPSSVSPTASLKQSSKFDPSDPDTLQQHSSGPGTPLEGEVMGDCGGVSSADLETIIGCLQDICTVLRTASYTLVQPPIKAFPTTAKVTGPPNTADPYQTLYHMFHTRNLLESVLVLISCPATSGHESISITVVELLTAIMKSLKGLLYLSSNQTTTKALCQCLTANLDDEAQEESLLQQLGLQLLYSMATLQYIDQLRQATDKGLNVTRADCDEVIEIMRWLYSISFTTVGRTALALVFTMGDNMECLLPFIEPKEPGMSPSKARKTASHGYAAQILACVVQHNEKVTVLKHYQARLELCSYGDPALSKWLSPIEGVKLDSSCIGKMIEFINKESDELGHNLLGAGPGIVTCLRVLRQLACAPEDMQSGDQQMDLQYKLSVIQLYSSSSMNAFINVIKRLGDRLLRPWQQGFALSNSQVHLIEAIVTPVLQLIKVMLSELLASGSVQFKDERLVTYLLPLHTVLCSVPSSIIMPTEAQQVQADIIDILLSYTVLTSQQPDTEEGIANSSWTVMLKEVLKYIPSGPYAYIGGLTVLSELLPLPLPMQAQEPLSSEQVQQALNHRRLWSLYLLSESMQIQQIIKDLTGSSCLPLQQILRRVCWQLADLAAPTALTVVRSLLDVLIESLAQGEEGAKKAQQPGDIVNEGEEVNKKTQPCGSDTARILTLVVYLVSQPAIKAPLLHLFRSSLKSDEKYSELLPWLLSLLNVVSDSPCHLQAQECIVALLQSICGPEITLLVTDTQPISEQLANSLPGKEHMEIICCALLDHVTSSDQSYASILPSLRTLLMLLDYDYGFFYVKCALDKTSSAFHSLFTRLQSSFHKDSSDYVSTLSTTLDLLQMLLTIEGPSEGDQDTCQEDGGPYRTKMLNVGQLKEYLMWGVESHPLCQLEKTLIECCKEDEILESLLDSISSLIQTLDSPEEPGGSKAASAPLTEITLPAPMSLLEQFNTRTVFYMGDDRLNTGFWLGPPGIDDGDIEPEMVQCDLEELRVIYFPDLDLQAELEKDLSAENLPQEKDQKKRSVRRKYESLTSRSQHRFNYGIKRAHNQSGNFNQFGRPMPGRSGRGYDIFRQRAQNTSRPPSMHVDDFLAAEANESTDSKKQQRGPQQGRSGRGGGFMGGAGGQRGGFQGGRGPWNGPANNYGRRDGGGGAQRGGRGGGGGGGGQWNNRQQQRPGYGNSGTGGNNQQRNFASRRWEGNQSSRTDNRMDTRQDSRGQVSGQQPYGRMSGDNRNREGSYMQRGEPRGNIRGNGSQQRGGANMRRPGRGFRSGSAGGRGSGGGGGGGGGWTGQGGKDQYSRFQQTPKTGRGGRMGLRENQGRHSRSFTR